MYIAYYDEAGDDGYPKYSSKMFILTCVYIKHSDWKEIFENLLSFRRQLKEEYGLPVKYEMHTKQFLLNKKPYRQHEFPDETRIEIIEKFLKFLANQNSERIKIQIVNVVIDKTKIKNSSYRVLDEAFKYSIQRIENTLNNINKTKKKEFLSKLSQENLQTDICTEICNKYCKEKRFLIITDEGRLPSMCKTARKIQRINYIPSQYDTTSTRNEIKLLIEDPLSKKSKESYFIQISDMMSYILNLFMLKNRSLGDCSNRLPEEITEEKLKDWMDILKPVLNLKASSRDEYGIVWYPK
jgi:hypothetical protein